jgi:hypothetical protein
MPDLLQTTADRTARYVMGLASAFEEDIHDLKGDSGTRLLRRNVSGARFLNQSVAKLVDIVEEWRSGIEEALREGMNGDDFRVIAGHGEQFSKVCVGSVEQARQLWDQLERMGAAPDDVREAREHLSATKARVLALKGWTDRLVKLSERKPPEIDPALIEKGAEEIRQGRFKTGEQILQSIRKTSN